MRSGYLFPWFFFLALLPFPGRAQSVFGDLPALQPGYSTNFSIANGLVQPCVSDVTVDRQGRLWLTTCPVMSGVNSVRLLQFDGYDFTPINLGNDSLPQRTVAVLRQVTKRGELLGWFENPEINAIFLFDPDRQTARIVKFDLAGEGIIGDVVADPNGRLLVALVTTDSLRLCSIDPALRKLYLAGWPVARPDTALPQRLMRPVSLGVFDREALVAGLYVGGIWHVPLGAGAARPVLLTGFSPSSHRWPEPLEVLSDRFSGRWFELAGGEQLCFVPSEQGEVLLRPHAGAGFARWRGLPAGHAVRRVEQDAAGNLLFLLSDPQGKYSALLCDRTGKRYDYSAFVAGQTDIYNVRSTDFFKSVFVGAASGLTYMSIREQPAIQCLLPGHQVRGMAELQPGQFFISNQEQLPVVFSAASGSDMQVPAGDPLVRAFGLGFSRRFNRAPDGSIWSNRKDTLVRYEPLARTHRDHLIVSDLWFTYLLADGRLALFSTTEGIVLYDPATGRSGPLPGGHSLRNFQGLLHNMYQTRDGRLWLQTTNGLWSIDLPTGTVRRLGYELPFRDFRFMCMEESDDGRLWLGTFLGGIHIYDPASGLIQVVDKSRGLPDNTIASITRDRAGKFWAATFRGLACLSADGTIVASYFREEGLCELEFNRYAALAAQNGDLLLGTVSGLHVLNPPLLEAQRRNHDAPQIYLCAVTSAGPEGSERTVRSSLDLLSEIVLPPDHRYLRVRFALSAYEQPGRNQFAYRLDGIESKWTAIGSQHELAFNNLPPGRYTLLIKGCDAQGNWTPEPVRIAIRARDFFYKQPWFYVVSLLPFLAFALVWVQRLRSEKTRLEKEVGRRTLQIQKDMELIEQQSQELRRLDEMKSRFFTNISHELRTPITLITAPVEQLERQYAASDNAHLRQSLQWVLHNGRKLADLVEELLELSRLEAGKVELQESPTALYPYCRQVFGAFESQAIGKNLGYKLDFESGADRWVAIDRRRLEKIVNNLLANALKFTAQGGRIAMRVGCRPAGALPSGKTALLTIRVEDSGRGIPPADLRHVFDRYFQTQRTDIAREGGIGIGLSLAKELAVLMQGDLQVESVWGQGSIFTLSLPVRELAAGAAAEEGPGRRSAAAPTLPAPVMAPAAPAAHILIVEDNPDMQALLRSILTGTYTLTVVADGQEALQQLDVWNDAGSTAPDLILSDVMMPRLDGYGLLGKLKEDPRWQMLPVVLLTARAGETDRLEALRLGVDDYLVKPFSPRELTARMANLIGNYRRRAGWRSKPDFVFEPVDSRDAVWLKRVETVAKAAVDKGTPLLIATLAEACAVSERLFYREIKRLTGLTPHQYILEVRLQKARHLLQHHAYSTLAEVAYAVGFHTPGYFTRVFEKHFGKHPSAYFPEGS